MTLLQFLAASIGLAIVAFGWWNAGKLGWSECRVFYWRAQAKEGWASAAHWQQQAGEYLERLRERGL